MYRITHLSPGSDTAREVISQQYLHNCQKTHNTDACNEPIIDRHCWMQHYIRRPDILGKDDFSLNLTSIGTNGLKESPEKVPKKK
jgi:hypothetical protein